MRPNHLPFLDWLKTAGISVIIVGHVAAPYVDHLTQPFNPKQLGVAFFLFATAFTLALDARRTLHILFLRLFDIFLFGIAFALLVSATNYFAKGSLALSNYAPFILGVNVLWNHFPANPTTWFIGTYIHILLLWAVMRNVRIRLWMLVAAALAEIGIRATVMTYVGHFTAYMIVPNWMTVFLLGLWCGQRFGRDLPRISPLAAATLAVAIASWFLWIARFSFDNTFPFHGLPDGAGLSTAFAISMLVTMGYVSCTLAGFFFACLLPDSSFSRLLARNTLILFIAHMPVYYALTPVLASAVSTPVRACIQIVVCLVFLALVSEIILRLMRPQVLRERLWNALSRRPATSTPTLDSTPVAKSTT